MQGRQGQNKDSWELFSSQHLASVNGNGTGKQRAIPRRPSRAPYLSQPPTTPRIGRPQRNQPQKVNWRRRGAIVVILLILCIVIAYGIGYATYNFFAGVSGSAAPATVAASFLDALHNQDYNQASSYLGPAIAPGPSQDFQEQAQTIDGCDGTIVTYTEIAGSATIQGDTQSFSYTITRSKLSHSYTLVLTLEQDSNGTWQITSYHSSTNSTNNNLGPGQSLC